LSEGLGGANNTQNGGAQKNQHTETVLNTKIHHQGRRSVNGLFFHHITDADPKITKKTFRFKGDVVQKTKELKSK
jgi:hypothetical protein